MPEKINAPWTAEQVAAMLAYQRGNYPYRCGFECYSELFPTTDGWVCGQCGKRQTWAWASSVEFILTLPRS